MNPVKFVLPGTAPGMDGSVQMDSVSRIPMYVIEKLIIGIYLQRNVKISQMKHPVKHGIAWMVTGSAQMGNVYQRSMFVMENITGVVIVEMALMKLAMSVQIGTALKVIGSAPMGSVYPKNVFVMGKIIGMIIVEMDLMKMIVMTTTVVREDGNVRTMSLVRQLLRFVMELMIVQINLMRIQHSAEIGHVVMDIGNATTAFNV